MNHSLYDSQAGGWRWCFEQSKQKNAAGQQAQQTTKHGLTLTHPRTHSPTHSLLLPVLTWSLTHSLTRFGAVAHHHSLCHSTARRSCRALSLPPNHFVDATIHSQHSPTESPARIQHSHPLVFYYFCHTYCGLSMVLQGVFGCLISWFLVSGFLVS